MCIMDRSKKKAINLNSIIGLFVCITIIITPSLHAFPHQQQLQQKPSTAHEELHSLNIERNADGQPSYTGRSSGNNANEAIATKATNETLNSTLLSGNATNELEKPVLKAIDRNAHSNGTASDAMQSAASAQEEEAAAATALAAATTATAAGTTAPWLPIAWIANLQPSNAIVITDTNPLRIWAIGSISKFPAFMERFVQRIQSYYSIYKYHDLSRPVSQAVINSQYHQHDEGADEALLAEGTTTTTDEIEIETTTEPLAGDSENGTKFDEAIDDDDNDIDGDDDGVDDITELTDDSTTADDDDDDADDADMTEIQTKTETEPTISTDSGEFAKNAN